jgi:hypothetical protein
MCLSSPRGARDETPPVGQASVKAAPAKMAQQAPPDMDTSKRTTQEPTTVSLQRELPACTRCITPSPNVSLRPHHTLSSHPSPRGGSCPPTHPLSGLALPLRGIRGLCAAGNRR